MSEEAVKATEETTEAKPTIAIAEAGDGGDAPKTEAHTTTAEAHIAGGSPETEATPTIRNSEGTEEVSGKEVNPTIIIPQANEPEEVPAEPEDVHYQAVEKEGTVTALWEMQGQKHIRTIDPRSVEGKQILALFETAA